MKIAFLTIATNKYVGMARELYDTMCQHAFPDQDVQTDLICFTNDPQSFYSLSGRVKARTVFLTHVPFPLISLLRYHYYSSASQILSEYDFVYHIDCDMLLKDKIGNDILGDRVCVIHPGFPFHGIPVDKFPYDRNEVSKAYVPIGGGKHYFQNCFQGGITIEFLNMCTKLRDDIEKNLRENYIARWHDESYMNRYMIDNPPSKILPPTYAQPQGWGLFGPTKILHVEKNHTQVRQTA